MSGEEKYWIAFYRGGEHNVPISTRVVSDNRANLGVVAGDWINNIRGAGGVCCWEAWDKTEQVVAYSLCNAPGDTEQVHNVAPKKATKATQSVSVQKVLQALGGD